jgi:MFS family permease
MATKFSTSYHLARKITANRQAVVIGAGILLTMLPVTMIVTVLKELVSVRHQVDTFWAHVFMSTSLAGAILFAPLAGVIIDRAKNRQKVIGIALIGNAICFFAMAMAPNFTVLILARFIEGAMHITALSAWLAAGADLSPAGRSGRMMGALGGAIMLGITIGVPLGGIIARNEARWVLWAAGLVSLFTAIFALFTMRRHTSRVDSPKQALGRLIRQNRRLAIPYIYTFIDRLCVGVVVSTFTIYMTDILLLSPPQRGGQLSFFLLPLALLSYPAGRLSDRIGRIGLMVIGSIFFGLVLMSYGFLNHFWLGPVMLASGILSAIMFAPTLAMCKDLAASEHYGSVFAGFNVAGSLGFLIGPLLGGSLFLWFQQEMPVLEAYRWTFVITGSTQLLCVVISWPFLWRFYRSKGHLVA